MDKNTDESIKSYHYESENESLVAELDGNIFPTSNRRRMHRNQAQDARKTNEKAASSSGCNDETNTFFGVPVTKKQKKSNTYNQNSSSKVEHDVAKKKHPVPVDAIMVTSKKQCSLSTNTLEMSNPYPLYRRYYDCCLHCGHRTHNCHKVKYSKYCIKAVYEYLQDKNNDHGWLAGFSPARMENVFGDA